MPPRSSLQPFPLNRVKLMDGIFLHRFNLNRDYVMSLKDAALLQNFNLEAGLTAAILRGTHPVGVQQPWGEDWHWGWESPTCQLRGHFLGHWLSAAAKIYASTGDPEVKLKLDRIVEGLDRCQKNNGGEWCGPIPEKYLEWTSKGHPTWAPHYVIHKALMGLFDAYAFAGSRLALDIMVNWARWFHRWTGRFTQEQMDNILDVETGGMLESWANLYGVTGQKEHLDLIERYNRRRLFDSLLEGRDAMTNLHANSTVPEAQGAARAYEVTGDERWRKVVEAYWKCAVTDRGAYCTGGQTCGEIWSAPFALAARLGDKTQEHCVVYNMIRLAECLLRWTGDPSYGDYIERNLWNGILAQQHPGTGMISYYLPLQPGGKKVWGTPTNDFWCCHGSLVQAHTIHNSYICYEDADGLVVTQYIPFELDWERPGNKITVRQSFDMENWYQGRRVSQAGATSRPKHWLADFSFQMEKPAKFVLKLRMPWWLAGKAVVTVNGKKEEAAVKPSTCAVIRRTWKDGDKVRLELPKGLWTCSLPDEPETVAFMDGPMVIAGLCDEQCCLHGDKEHPESILAADKEREGVSWQNGYRTVGQERTIRFVPLHEVVDDRYTVYFPVRR